VGAGLTGAAALDLPTRGSPICVGRHRREGVMVRYRVEKMGCGGCARTVIHVVTDIRF